MTRRQHEPQRADALHNRDRIIEVARDALAVSGDASLNSIAKRAVLHAATSDGLAGETYGPVIGAITLLLRACEEAGRIRPGLEPDDVLLLMGFLWRIDSTDWETRASPLLDVVVDGLRAGAQVPAPAGERR